MKIYKYTKNDMSFSPGFQFLRHKFPYFTIKYKSNFSFFFICNGPIRYKDRNKTSILYKEVKKFKYQVNEIMFADIPEVSIYWVGYYDSDKKTFYKNRFYKQSIDIDQVLKFLQGRLSDY